MDKEKKAFVEDEDVKEINRSAEKAYMFKTNNDSRYRTEYNRLAALVVGRISREKITNICRDDYQEYAAYTFIGCFKDWKPGKADFWAYYKSIVNRRKNDIYTEKLDTLERGAYRKMKKNKSDTADINREDIFYSSEDDNSVKVQDSVGWHDSLSGHTTRRLTDERYGKSCYRRRYYETSGRYNETAFRCTE